MGKCPNCKTEFKPSAILCENCGELLEGVASASDATDQTLDYIPGSSVDENSDDEQSSGAVSDTLDFDPHATAEQIDSPSGTGISDTLDYSASSVEMTDEEIAEALASPNTGDDLADTIDFAPRNPLLRDDAEVQQNADLRSMAESTDGEQTVDFDAPPFDGNTDNLGTVQSEAGLPTDTLDFSTDGSAESSGDQTIDYANNPVSDDLEIEEGGDGDATLDYEVSEVDESESSLELSGEDLEEIAAEAPHGDDVATYVADEVNLDDGLHTLDVDAASANASDSDVSDTLDLGIEEEVSSSDGQATLEQPGQGSVNLIDDDDFEVDLDGDEKDTQQISGDLDEGTATLDVEQSADPVHGATMDQESFDTQVGSGANTPSGTEGRLKRLWEGVAGSGESPMASLQGIGMEASDTVFDRVAMRKVADAGPEYNIQADYQVIDKLGEGAMGVVLSARQAGVERVVALKTAKPNYQKSDESRRRFLYEAQITADLGHSNIVPIYELGSSEEGMLFYSMKLVEGTPWNQVIKDKKREENLDIFMKVCDAMAFAHSKGVIHRDLKPENTMLGTFGEVFVTDWGTALNLQKDSSGIESFVKKGSKHLVLTDPDGFRKGDAVFFTDGDELYDRRVIDHFDSANPNRIYFKKRLTRDYEPVPALRMTKLMTMAGTPCYMSPEMAGHKMEKLGPTSDIYVLGAILFEIVTGKPPHIGKSITECLRAALTNEVVEAETNDSLLKIAFKAMATETEDRYRNVEALQEAVREYRRHSESIALSNRSKKLLKEGIKNKDYETFSRSMFGYQDAIDLWDENEDAVEGLKTARLAYSRIAYEKGDYDLVLQTVDKRVAEEEEVYEKAIVAKKKAEGREAKVKLLQRAVAAVVLFAVVGLSGLSVWAMIERANAVKQTRIAEKNEKEAKEQTLLAEKNEKTAIANAEEAERQKGRAEENEETAISNANEAKRLKGIAEENAKIAIANANEAKQQREIAVQQKEIADNKRKEAEVARIAESKARAEAQLRAAQIQLGEYQSSLALAKSQIESFDIEAGRASLDRLRNLTSDVFRGLTPEFDTWGWQRINLLSNADLPVSKVDGTVTSIDYAPNAGLAVIGTAEGKIQTLRYTDGKLAESNSLQNVGAAIVAVAISSDGSKVAFSSQTNGTAALRFWELKNNTSVSVSSAGNRLFEQVRFSNDGSQLIAGLSAGIWTWNTSIPNWFEQAQPTNRITNIRGQLARLDPLTQDSLFFATRFQGDLLAGLASTNSGRAEIIEFPAGIEGRVTAVAPISLAPGFGGLDLALALDDNSVAIGTIQDSSLRVVQLLEDKHRAPVTDIRTNGSQQIVTSSQNEPVAHVWEKRENEWLYDTFLTGTTENLSGIGMIGPDTVLGVDIQGSSIVWNVSRQKQRRRLGRTSDSQEQEYLAPASNVFAGASDGQAITIDDNGAVDLWSLVDGSTKAISSQRWSYVGHTPGAELVDSAIDIQQDLIITAANLKNAEKRYLEDPSHSWEFCVWNKNTGNMVRRWTAANRRVAGLEKPESIEQRISLLDSGRQLISSSDKITRIQDLADGRETFLRDDFGTYFAVPNPQSSRLAMLVKRSGSIRLLDLDRPEEWENKAYQCFKLADPSDIPLDGAWSSDGLRFYVVFTSGGVAKFSWNGKSLELDWSSRSLQRTDDSELAKVLLGSGRIRSHLDLDISLTQSSTGDELHFAHRTRGKNPTTRLASIRFDNRASAPQLVGKESRKGIHWLRIADNSAALTSRIHDKLLVDSSRVQSRLRVNNQIFVSTKSANVLALTEGQVNFASFGRSKLLDSAGSRNGQVLYALLEGGFVWKFAVAGGAGEWSKLSLQAEDATSISSSGDGRLVALKSSDQCRIYEIESGALLTEVGAVQEVSWDPSNNDRLAIAKRNGDLHLWEGGNLKQLATKVPLSVNEEIVSLSHFIETWGEQGKPSKEYLLVQTEDQRSGKLHFVPLAAGENGEVVVGTTSQDFTIPLGTQIAASPNQAVLATGTPSGTVTIWFATPSWDPNPGQLYDLEGHRGADITCLKFSSDGKTLITADAKNRLYAWLSTDPLVKSQP